MIAVKHLSFCLGEACMKRQFLQSNLMQIQILDYLTEILDYVTEILIK